MKNVRIRGLFIPKIIYATELLNEVGDNESITESVTEIRWLYLLAQSALQIDKIFHANFMN